MYYSEDTVIFLNGQWMKAKDATVSMYLQTLHYGNGVFEGIRSYASEHGFHVFKAYEHYRRLLNSAEQMHIDLPYTAEELVALTYQLLGKNNVREAYIRPLVYMQPNMHVTPGAESGIMISAWEWEPYLGYGQQRLMTSKYRRPHPESTLMDAKVVGHYANNFLATAEAKQKGYDEALMLDVNGHVACGPVANFFFEKDGVLYTAPEGHIMAGITRATVLDLAKELGFEVVQKHFTPEDVWDADGAFFTGTAVEIAGIHSLDGVPFRKDWEDTMGFDLHMKYRRMAREQEEPMAVV